MDEEALKRIAGQLRKPHGEYAIQVAERMNEGNFHINLNTIEALKPEKGNNILEIGMGNGFFVKDILSHHNTIKYTGCDISPVMVEEARRQNQKFVRIGQAQFYLASADKLPFEEELFDKIFTVNTIYFWSDPKVALSEIRRVLKPKGQIVIAVRPKSVMEHYPFVKYGFTMFNKTDLKNLLIANSFKLTSIVEKEEPPQEINGEKLPVETLLVCGEK